MTEESEEYFLNTIKTADEVETLTKAMKEMEKIIKECVESGDLFSAHSRQRMKSGSERLKVAKKKYETKCIDLWIGFFKDPKNRIPIWRE